MELIGKVLSGRYEIIQEIGEGGMAHVYKARCKLLNRNVAVKVLKSEFSKDDTFVKRFRTEAQSAASLTHPNIVQVYDVGEEKGVNYIVMELLESRTLKDYIEEKGALSINETLNISQQIASALETAHKAHIVHRDIKPQNIVLSKNLVAKVTDFGIAKATTSSTITNFGTTMGSVHYFSPEHAKGGYTDEKSDIYSLGVVMYEMATGRVPFDSDSPVSVALKHIQETAVSPMDINSNISETLNNIILKAMAKNTANRYKNATQLLDDINEAMTSLGRVSKLNSSIEAGVTQVIPVLTEDIIEDNVVPNLRTRNARRMSVVTSRREEAKNIETEKDSKNKNNKKDMSKQKKTLIISAAIVATIVVIITIFFAVKIINKIRQENRPLEMYEVPNLIGRSFEEVVAEYAKQDIEIIQDKVQYDDTQPEGFIISQTPEKNVETSDRKIYVIVSKGQKMVNLPDVTGKDIKVVKYELQDTLGFVLEIEEVVNDKVLANMVISQSPDKNTELPFGSVVKLKVSKGDGKEVIVMPSVIGMTKDKANKTLTDLKLNVKFKNGEDKGKANGIVIAQNYPQNQELKEGDLVEITINRLLVTKTITLNLTELKGSTEYDNDIEVKVTASIDGSAANNVYDKTLSPSTSKVEFTLNGYENANLKIYINGKEVKTQTVKFTE